MEPTFLFLFSERIVRLNGGAFREGGERNSDPCSSLWNDRNL